jgi:uncharacterized protein
MTTIILSIVIVLMSALGLAVGILFGRAPIKGSCGGLACLKDAGCDGCSRTR